MTDVALITGASRGIGRASALRLARAGMNVLLHGTDTAKLEELAQEVTANGAQAAILAGDVADPKTASRAVEATLARFGRIDVLVNNAGINTRSSTLEMPLDDWQRVMDVNLNGTLHFCRAVLPTMIAQGRGSIVNVSSTTAKTPHRNAAPAYGASKAAVNYLTMHLAQEMAPNGIRVNAVCPGPVETDMSDQWSAEYRKTVTARVPLGRLGTPEEIAEIVAFLASDASGFITGETINANGGTYMN
ncbi:MULTISPECIES: SDR family NAD(P)-dependent oxidoreductase [Mameliella]|uniref:Short-chain dehydrogenase/reductase SDR n=1 Tax=Mameliella alba TaxID=561184 RepID=A0A0B3SMV6_9RHOB|nr:MULTISPECIES: SDR family NAD(P)-dependent oxidoreductase [Mameliella]KHQ51854.1 Short-chain dehydrogenase/reductase SDR [Mameliella alba]MDD9728723.1 SDR family NAD(P)-dependent oxidoreductase [Mameliella sp. AT18]ODM47598.1 3-ketoacyl-ACP reductase [Ruegeria sp. PBVC088]